jgi:HD-GYP domain-containing protein (c-di-GMP phosphodiesterase class II)
MPHEFPPLPERKILPEALPETTAEHLSQARLICQAGDYATILQEFSLPENTALWEEQRTRVKKEGEAHTLRDATLSLHEHDWEMLTILELFDRSTYEHCLRTYAIAKQKIESRGEVGAYLRQKIAKEGLTPWDIEHACLLHDIGKIALTPKDLILNNTLTNEEWHELFAELCHSAQGGHETLATYEETLATRPELREKDLTPLRVALTEEQATALQKNGINVSLPLGDIIAKHQDISVAIVGRYYKNTTLLELIGNHHEKTLSFRETRPIAQSAVRVASLIDTLRLADVFDAFHSARPYKKGEGIFSTLALLSDRAQTGFVDEYLVFLWIKDELTHFDSHSYLHTLKARRSDSFENEQASHKKITRFLASFYQEAA